MYKHLYITNRTNYLYLKGGNFEDDYEEAKLKIRQILDNSAFFSKKITELQGRLHQIVAEDEHLFRLKTKIEYIIGKLEECGKDKDTHENTVPQFVVHNLDELVEILETYDNQDMVSIIKDIESLLSYVEQFLTKKKDPDLQKLAEQFKTVKEKLNKNKKSD
jgi:hypothetical protein